MPRPKKQVLKQRADGRYCCKYHGIQFMGNTSDEALALRDEYKRREASGELSASAERFSAYAMRWVRAYKGHLTDGPYNTHVRNLNRFLDLVGDKRLQDVLPSDIARYYQLYAGMSMSSIHSARDTIKGVFKAALADGLIKSDPAAHVDPPKGVKGTHREITDEERALIHAADHRLRPAVFAMLYAGLRRGEALALNIERDVDFPRKTLTVREAVRFGADGKPILVQPKTAAGVRTLPLLDVLAAELRPLSGLLCPSASGQLMTESAWKRAWNSYINALGETRNHCPRRWPKYGPWQPVTVRAHDLRHSYCTMLYNAGVDLKTAMLWMGHADQTMTMQIYTHLTESRRQSAETALRNAEKTLLSMQNGMQSTQNPQNPLKINAPQNIAP